MSNFLYGLTVGLLICAVVITVLNRFWVKVTRHWEELCNDLVRVLKERREAS